MKKFLSTQMTNLKKKKEVESMIECRLEENMILAVDKAKRHLREIVDRHETASYKQMKERATLPN